MGGAAAAEARPNIVVILADDLGIGDMSAYRPGADVQTPHLDRLAAEGMRFSRMRANATVCSPTRAALMSGRYADRVGVPGLIRTDSANTWGYFDPNVPTIANHLRAAGYHTAIIGKWNLGLTAPGTPNDRGFDFFHGFLDDMMDSYTTHRRQGHNYMAAIARSSIRSDTPRIFSRRGRAIICGSAPPRSRPSFSTSPTTPRIFRWSRPPSGSRGCSDARLPWMRNAH